MMIQGNIAAPCTLLDFPTQDLGAAADHRTQHRRGNITMLFACLVLAYQKRRAL